MPYREFEFLNNGSSFVPLLQQMLRYINQYIKLSSSDKKQVLFESKVVITELLTNAIKHSGTEHTLMRIEISDNSLQLIKTDSGTPLQLLSHPQLAVKGQILTIDSDALHTLQAIACGDNTIEFTYTELTPAGLPELAGLAEHFGLLLILKTAQHLFYQYHADTGLNVFTTQLLFKKQTNA